MKAIYENRNNDFYYRSGLHSNLYLTCGPHLHYHVELVYIEQGSVIAYVDSESYEMKKGDFLIVFPNKIHYFDDVEGNINYHLFIINPDFIPELSDKLCGDVPLCPVIRNTDRNERLMSLISILSDTSGIPEQAQEVVMKGYLMAFFGEILGMLTQNGYRSDDSVAMRAIVRYCSKNFTHDLSLSVLEEELHLSKYYISHLFGSKLGIRFNDYVNSLRISEACRYLRTSNMSVTDIAAVSGFGTLRTFNRAFIKKMGMSPSSYRKNLRTGNSASLPI